MSQAFRDQWTRQSVNKQLLTILTYLTRKHGELVIPLTELEHTTAGVSVESIDDTSLTLRYAPPGTRMFVLTPEPSISERNSTSWQSTTNNDPNVPSRLAPQLEPELTSPVSTLDDMEMARREQQMHRAAAAAEQARVLRGQPLPVTTPLHPPS